MAKNIELSIVILNYNAKDYLTACLSSIPSHTNWEIIVADNGSTDDSLSLVRRHFPHVKIVAHNRNLGFAGGNNHAIVATSGKFILLLNPDTVVQGQAIEVCLEYIKSHPQVGAVTCRVELPDGSLDYSSHRNFPDPINSLLHFLGLRRFSKYSHTQIPTDIHEIEVLTGAFALIRRPAGEQVNWLDEDYFWNGEDIDFCYKLHEAGWKVVFIPSQKIIHHKGYAAKKSYSSRLKWAKNSTDVMWLFYSKHLTQKYPLPINLIVFIGIKLLYFIRLFKAAL